MRCQAMNLPFNAMMAKGRKGEREKGGGGKGEGKGKGKGKGNGEGGVCVSNGRALFINL